MDKAAYVDLAAQFLPAITFHQDVQHHLQGDAVTDAAFCADNDRTTKMDLLLWRHAEAEDGEDDAEAEDGEDDLKRRLTERGQKQARAMAKWIRERQPKDLRIIVSPRSARSRRPRRLNCRLKPSARSVRRPASPN
jgi:hypothetical protein